MDIPGNTTAVTIACICGSLLLTGIFTAIVALPFLGICGGLGWFMSERSKQAKAARDAAKTWPSTTGTVVLSRVEVSRVGTGTSVTPHVVYRYEAGGQAFEYDQIRAGDKLLSIRMRNEAYKLVDRYPAGATVTVYYNPQNPGEAALER